MSARSVTAAAALAAAVAVLALVRRRDRRLRREAVAQRLMAGRMQGDNAALRLELEGFRRRMNQVLASQAALTAAGLALEDALSTHTPIDQPMEGGPR